MKPDFVCANCGAVRMEGYEQHLCVSLEPQEEGLSMGIYERIAAAVNQLSPALRAESVHTGGNIYCVLVYGRSGSI